MIAPQPEGLPAVQNMIASSGRGGPTALRILLGAQLRRLREARRITLGDAGYAIRASGSKISRLETGRVGFKSRDIADLLSLYGVTNEQDRSPAGYGSGGEAMTADDQAAAIKDEAWDQAAAIRREAEREAAAIRRQAESRAAAIREAAEREAAELRSALLAMSGELGRAAAYVTQNLAPPE
jgi:transcriptional regulator with XRE-family HTH domain